MVKTRLRSEHDGLVEDRQRSDDRSNDLEKAFAAARTDLSTAKATTEQLTETRLRLEAANGTMVDMEAAYTQVLGSEGYSSILGSMYFLHASDYTLPTPLPVYNLYIRYTTHYTSSLNPSYNHIYSLHTPYTHFTHKGVHTSSRGHLLREDAGRY